MTGELAHRAAVSRDRLIELLNESAESESLDYKEALNPREKRDFLKLVKHVGAMQVEGGYIVIGADSHGKPSDRFNLADPRLFDEAELRKGLRKYIPEPFVLRSAVHEVEGQQYVIIYTRPHQDGLCIFKADGSYRHNGEEVFVFREGDIFVRHGSSSERAQQHDLNRIFRRGTSSPSPIPGDADATVVLPVAADESLGMEEAYALGTVKDVLISEHEADPTRIALGAGLHTDLDLERPEILELIMTVEEVLELELPDETFIGVEFQTVDDLVALFVSQLAAQGRGVRQKRRTGGSPHTSRSQSTPDLGNRAALPEPDLAEVGSSSSATATRHAVGDVIDDRFRILQVIGEGGFAKVYRVLDELEGEQRAFKLFNSAAGYEAVRREMTALRRISHPNVVKVYWAGKTNEGDWYLITEYIHGTSLDNYVRANQQLGDRKAVDVAMDIVNALVAIHPDSVRLGELDGKKREGELSEAEFQELLELQGKGLVHRDIKPQNVVLTDEGAKLLDFNIASRVGDPVMTQSGTPPYQAPEADLTLWDVSTDLFAVGVLLYELLCDGQHPYPGGKPMAGTSITDPRTIRPDLDGRLVRFLKKACAPRRDERFATAAEMAAELRGIQHGAGT